MRMVDRWQSRPEPGPGEAQLCWHVLMRDQPQIRALAAVAQRRLADFPGLHLTPEQWVHLSVLRVGLTTDIPAAGVQAMIAEARLRLSPVAPVTAAFGQVLYDREAISLGMRPGDALDPLAAAIRAAALAVTGQPGRVTEAAWTPHVTLAYSTSDQPAEPIIGALGRELPEGQITIDKVSLVAQHGPERDWRWQLVDSVLLTAQP